MSILLCILLSVIFQCLVESCDVLPMEFSQIQIWLCKFLGFLHPRHISFVDCPGHDILMATMLNGAAVMDAALLLVAGNESCPQPQTSEHLAAIEIMKLEHILILQNKIDLVKESQAREQSEQIARFVKGTYSSFL